MRRFGIILLTLVIISISLFFYFNDFLLNTNSKDETVKIGSITGYWLMENGLHFTFLSDGNLILGILSEVEKDVLNFEIVSNRLNYELLDNSKIAIYDDAVSFVADYSITDDILTIVSDEELLPELKTLVFYKNADKQEEIKLNLKQKLEK